MRNQLLLLSAGVLTTLATAQGDETLFPANPKIGDRFGDALAMAPLGNGTSRDWAIVGKPNGDLGAGQVDAGLVECVPPPLLPIPRIRLQAPPGQTQAGARFGAAIVVGDVNADGNVDLVVGAPGYDAAIADQGRVYVFFGPWQTNVMIPYANWAYLDVAPGDASIGAEPGGTFGHSLAIGDLDLDGDDDIAVGAPHATHVAATRTADAGAVDLFRKVVPNSGATAFVRNHHLYEQGNKLAPGNQFGHTVEIGQFAEDFFGGTGATLRDVAVGSPGYDYTQGVHTLIDKGRIQFFFGRLGGGGRPRWNNATPFRQGHMTGFINLIYPDNERLGWAMDAVDYDNNGWDDLAVSALGDDAAGIGFVALLRGTPTHVQWRWAPNPPDLRFADPAFKGPGHRFGASVQWLERFGSPGIRDLAVGITSLGGTQEAVMILDGQPNEIIFWQTAQTLLWTSALGTVQYGARLAAGNRDNGGADDLMVGIPLEPIAGSAFLSNQ